MRWRVLAAILLATAPALAQSPATFQQGQTLNAAQLNAAFAAKADYPIGSAAINALFATPPPLGNVTPNSVFSTTLSSTGAATHGIPGTNNALTITPGAAPTNLITFSQSGTGNYTFGSGQINASGFIANAGGINGGTFNYSGSQPIAPGAQYGLLAFFNMAGSVTSGTIAANRITIPTDTAVIPHNAIGAAWLNISGSYGQQPWLPTTSYASGNVRANNGNTYTETVASCTSGSTGPSGTGSGIADGTCSWNYAAVNGAGNRSSISNNMTVRSQIGTSAGGTSIDQQWLAEINTAQITYNQGGTSLTAPAGTVYAGGDQSWCQNGATFMFQCTGREIDVGVFTGASSQNRYGLNIVSYGNAMASLRDTGLTFGGTTAGGSTTGFRNPVLFREGAVDPTGTLIAYQPVQQGNLITNAGTYINPVAAAGMNLAPYRFTSYAIQTAGNANFDGQGGVTAGAGKFSSTTAAVALDALGSVLATVASVSGVAVGYLAGDELYDDAGSGTILHINSVDANGKPLTWAVVVAGGSSGAQPPTMTFDGGTGQGAGTGTGVAFNVTWTRVATLSLNPSGTNILMANIPTAAPAAHCALWSNAGVITRSTCP